MEEEKRKREIVRGLEYTIGYENGQVGVNCLMCNGLSLRMYSKVFVSEMIATSRYPRDEVRSLAILNFILALTALMLQIFSILLDIPFSYSYYSGFGIAELYMIIGGVSLITGNLWFLLTYLLLIIL